MRFIPLLTIALGSVFLLPTASTASTLRWDADGNPLIGTPPTATPGSGTWNSTSAVWNYTTTDGVWDSTYAAQFGSSAAADGNYSITVESSAIGAAGLTFNSSGFTLSSTAATTLAMSGGLAVSGDKTATIGNNLTLTYSANVIFNTDLSTTGTGTLVIDSGGKISTTNDFGISQSNNAQTKLQVNAGGNFQAGRILVSSSGTQASLLQINGGTATLTGATIFIGQAANSSGRITLSSGAIQATSATSTDGYLQFGPTNSFTGSASGTFDLDGGTLTVAQIKEGAAGSQITSTFNFNGGTLKAKSATSLATTFFSGINTANVRNGGAIIDTNGQTITIAQNLTHSAISGDNAIDGGLTKVSSGTLILTGGNSYTGDTRVEAGTLSINSAYLYDQSNVLLSTGATFNLSFSGIDTINALYFNGIAQAIGTWGSLSSSAMNKSAYFTGTGILNVTAIPEPSSFVLIGIGAALCLLRQRCRR